jgi:hypothetical protein
LTPGPRARIALLLIVLATPFVVASPAAVASCGSVATSLREQVDDAEAVIVGTVTEAGVPDGEGPKESFGRPLRWTIEVERDVKGNVGDSLSFHAGWTGASTSNDFGADTGERVGLLLSRRDGAWWASSCDRRDAGEVLVAAEPLTPPRARGAPLLLASGGFGSPRVALLDERGRLARFGDGAGDAVMGVCPGERFVAEAISDRTGLSEGGRPTSVEIRDVATMRIVRRHRLPSEITTRIRERPFDVACRDARATDVLVAAEAGIYSSRVVRLQGERWETVYDAKARAVVFLPDGFAVIRHGGERFELAVHDADGDVRMRLGPLPTFKHLSISEPVRLAADPSGRFVAGANEEPDNGLENLFVADLERRKVARARVGWVDGLAWAGTDLVVAPLRRWGSDGYVDETGAGEVRVYDARLDRKASWDGWTGQHPIVLGERLYGVRPAERTGTGSVGPVAIVSAPYRTGPERVENALPEITVDRLIALSGEGAVERRPRFTWTAIGLVAFLLALLAIVIRSRRAKTGEPEEGSGAFTT